MEEAVLERGGELPQGVHRGVGLLQQRRRRAVGRLAAQRSQQVARLPGSDPGAQRDQRGAQLRGGCDVRQPVQGLAEPVQLEGDRAGQGGVGQQQLQQQLRLDRGVIGASVRGAALGDQGDRPGDPGLRRPGAAMAGARPGSVSIDTAAPVATTLETSLDIYSVPSGFRGAHINRAAGRETCPSCSANANVRLPGCKSTQDSHTWKEEFSHEHDIGRQERLGRQRFPGRERTYSWSRRAMVCAARAA